MATRTQSVLRKWAKILSENNIPEVDSSIKWISRYINPSIVNKNYEFTPQEYDVFENMCQQRLNHMPVQYIIGEW